MPNPITHTCPQCGASFHVKPSQASKRRFCRMACLRAYQKALTLKVCVGCGVEFRDPDSPTQKYCTHECYARNNRGEKNWHFKGGHVTGQGYIQICIDGRTVRGHRWVMEQKLGRQLDSHEIVHHIDGDPSNNQPDNLELMSSHAEHRKRHFVLYRDDHQKQCQVCREIMPRSEFYPLRNIPEGRLWDPHGATCRTCESARSRLRAEARRLDRAIKRAAKTSGS